MSKFSKIKNDFSDCVWENGHRNPDCFGRHDPSSKGFELCRVNNSVLSFKTGSDSKKKPSEKARANFFPKLRETFL